MRALYIPAEGEPEVIDRPIWPLDVIRHLGCGDGLVDVWPHRGASGQHIATMHAGPVGGVAISLLAQRPVLVFNLSQDRNLVSLNRRDVLYIGMIIVMEEALSAITRPTTTKEINGA